MLCEAQDTQASCLLYRFQNRAGVRAAGSFVMVAPHEWRCCMDATIYTLLEFGSFFYSIAMNQCRVIQLRWLGDGP